MLLGIQNIHNFILNLENKNKPAEYYFLKNVSSIMFQNFIDSLLAIRKTREADLCLSPGVTFSLLLCSPDASLYFNKPWMSDGYSWHTGSQDPYRCTTLPLAALYQTEAALCKLHWPLFLTPHGLPLLTSFLLSFLDPLFQSCSFCAGVM